MLEKADLQDQINSFTDLTNIIRSKIDNSVWHTTFSSDSFNIFKASFDSSPKISICITIKIDLTIIIWYHDVKLEQSKYSYILGKNCLVDRWSKLENILNYCNSYNETACSVEDKLSYSIRLLQEYIDESGSTCKRLNFLVEQLLLYKTKAPYYSPETLLWSSMLYYSSPHGYKLIRNSDVLKIPHPSYLKKLSFNSDMLNSGMSDSHLNYLKKKIGILTEEEKLVNLLLDEIHIKPTLSYKAGNIIQVWQIILLLQQQVYKLS